MECNGHSQEFLIMHKRSKSSLHRIAFLGVGAYSIPSYRSVLNALSENYDITVYFEAYREIKHEIKFSVKSVSKSVSKYGRIRELIFAWLLFRNLLFKSVNIIHAHSTFPCGFCGVILGKIFRIPVVVSLDGAEATALPDVNFGDLRGPRRKKINGWVIRNADRVIVLTEFQNKEIKSNL